MKVILLQDIARVGRKFEIKDIANGYALNHLIPQGLAEPATAKNIERSRAHEEQVAHKHLAKEEVFQELQKKLEKIEIEISAEANEQGHLFRGIHGDEIATTISEKTGTTIPEGSVVTDPIKEVGTHTVTLTFGAQELPCTVHIVAADKTA